MVVRPDVVARTTLGTKPPARSASVDVPLPLRPMTPTRSPAATTRSIPSSAGVDRPG